MARFRFPLQNIFALKQKLEEQAKSNFGVAMMRKNQEEAALKNLYMRKEAYLSERTAAMSGSINVIKLKQLEDAVHAVDDMIEQQKIKLRRAEQMLSLAQEKLNEAMKERKTFEKLRENAFEQFKYEVNSAEQQEINELVSFLHKENMKEGM